MRERQRPEGAGAPLTWWTVTLCVVLWFVVAGGARGRSPWALSAYDALVLDSGRVLAGEVWRLVTALLVHAREGALHLVMNMLFLFLFGREVEARLGTPRYAALLLAAGLAGTVLLTILGALSGEAIRALGASGAVFGVMAWLAVKDPRRPIHVFGLVPVPLALLVGVLMLGGDALQLASHGVGARSALGHLAGAAVGALVAWRGGISVPRVRTATPAAKSPTPPADEARLDALLEKISRSGIDALDAEERAFLEAASRRRRRDGSTPPG